MENIVADCLKFISFFTIRNTNQKEQNVGFKIQNICINFDLNFILSFFVKGLTKNLYFHAINQIIVPHSMNN